MHGHWRPLYERLQSSDSTTKEIRILRIHSSAHSTDDVKCTLEKCRLEDANPFYALSYIWGTQPPTAAIVVNEQVIQVRETLWQFLKALRDTLCTQHDSLSESRDGICVWVDRICIDQTNIDERNAQVSIMGDIYHSADATYAWLGINDARAGGGLRSVLQIKRLRGTDGQWAEILEHREIDLVRFRYIVLASYWNRMWIKQEVLLAKDLWFFQGTDMAHWQDVKFAFNLLPVSFWNSQEWHIDHLAGDEPAAARLMQSKRAMRSLLGLKATNFTPEPLHQLVTRFRESRCTDGKDKLYALLSLTDERTRRKVIVDYGKSLFEVLLLNFPHWSGEYVETTIDCRSIGEEVSVSIYVYARLCPLLANMMSAEELNTVCATPDARSNMSCSGAFRSSRPSRVLSLATIASFDGTQVQPRGDAQDVELEASNLGLVIHLAVQSVAPSHQHERPDYIAYVFGTPQENDYIVSIGSRLFFIRECNCSTAIVATGTEVQATFHSLSRTGRGTICSLHDQLLPHPCGWWRKQLPDATYDLSDATPNTASLGRKTSLTIICNAAAIIAIVREHALFSRNQSNEEVSPQLNVKPRHGSDELVSAFWSPYEFGRQNRLLDSCDNCRGRHATDGRLYYGTRACRWL